MRTESRQAGAEIELEITPEMIEAGVYELRRRCFGESMDDIVTAVYVAMNSERQVNNCSASSIMVAK